MTLDSLYDDALTRQAYNGQSTGNGMDRVALNPFAPMQQDPFLASAKVAPPPNVQLAALSQQQQVMMMHQQQAMMMQQQILGGGAHTMNPYNNGYGMPSMMMPPPNQYQSQMHSNPFGNPGLL